MHRWEREKGNWERKAREDRGMRKEYREKEQGTGRWMDGWRERGKEEKIQIQIRMNRYPKYVMV